MSTGNYNVSQFGQQSGIGLSDSQMTAGGLKREDVASKFLLIFDKIDEDKNGIIDSSEMEKFKTNIDGNQTSYIEKKEAKGYLVGEDGQRLTYQDENGKTTNLKAEDLNEFLAQYLQNVDINSIRSTRRIQIEGKSAVTITHNDESQDIIFDDKDEPQRNIVRNQETGAITTRYLKNGILLKEEVVMQNGDKVTTEYNEDGTKLTRKTTYTKENNGTSTITYTDGKPTSKDTTVGVKKCHYSIDEDGNELLETEVENEGDPVLEKRSTHTYDGNTETITITDNKKQSTTVQIKENGILTQERITEPNKNTVISYDENGRTETVTENGKTTVTEYNQSNHKISQVIIDGNGSHEALYDGEGHTIVQINAGETAQAMAYRINRNLGAGQQRVTYQQIVELNPNTVRANGQFRMQRLFNGQMGLGTVRVPDEIDATNGFITGRQTQAVANARAAEAETRLNNAMAGLNETIDYSLAIAVDFGPDRQELLWDPLHEKNKTYEDWAKKVISDEGLDSHPILIQRLAEQIATLNENKPVNELTSIKLPASTNIKLQYDAKITEAERARAAREQTILNTNFDARTQDGKEISDSLYEAMDGAGVDTNAFNAAIQNVTSENAAYVVSNYKTDHGKGISAAIADQTFTNIISAVGSYINGNDGNDLSITEKKNAIITIYNQLSTRCAELGINTDMFRARMSVEMAKVSSNEDLKNVTDAIDSILSSMAGSIQTQDKMTRTEQNILSQTSPTKFAQTVINNLNQMGDRASQALTTAHNAEGWQERVADLIGRINIQGNNNYYASVESDVREYRNKISEIAMAQQYGPEAVANAFRRAFGVDYNPVNIATYEALDRQWTHVDTLHAKLETFKSENETLLNREDAPSNITDLNIAIAHLAVQIDFPDKGIRGGANGEVMYMNKRRDEFIESVAGPKMQELYHKSWGEASLSEKYTVMNIIATGIQTQMQNEYDSARGGESYESLKERHTSLFKATYGDSDIVTRVEDYNHSQKVMADIINGGAIAVLTLATGNAIVATAIVESSESVTRGNMDDFSLSRAGENLIEDAGTITLHALGAGIIEKGGEIALNHFGEWIEQRMGEHFGKLIITKVGEDLAEIPINEDTYQYLISDGVIQEMVTELRSLGEDVTFGSVKSYMVERLMHFKHYI